MRLSQYIRKLHDCICNPCIVYMSGLVRTWLETVVISWLNYFEYGNSPKRRIQKLFFISATWNQHPLAPFLRTVANKDDQYEFHHLEELTKLMPGYIAGTPGDCLQFLEVIM